MAYTKSGVRNRLFFRVHTTDWSIHSLFACIDTVYSMPNRVYFIVYTMYVLRNRVCFWLHTTYEVWNRLSVWLYTMDGLRKRACFSMQILCTDWTAMNWPHVLRGMFQNLTREALRRDCTAPNSSREVLRSCCTDRCAPRWGDRKKRAGKKALWLSPLLCD